MVVLPSRVTVPKLASAPDRDTTLGVLAPSVGVTGEVLMAVAAELDTVNRMNRQVGVAPVVVQLLPASDTTRRQWLTKFG